MSSDAAQAETRPAEIVAAFWPSGLMPGLRGRLILAFATIILFVVVAAGAGLYAFREVGQKLDLITVKSVPPALIAGELSREAESIVAAGPALLDARDANDVEALSGRASSGLVDASTTAERLRSAKLDPAALDAIEDVLAELDRNLSRIRAVRLDAIAAAERKHRLLNDIFAARRQFTAVWRPRFTDLRGRVIRLQRTMTSPTASDDERRKALDQFEQAMIGLLSLDQIQREAGTAFEEIIRLANISDPAQLDGLVRQVGQAMLAIDALVSDMEPEVASQLSEPIVTLRTAATGDASMLAAARSEIAAKAEGERLITENEALSARLETAVKALVSQSRGEIDGASLEVKRVEAVGRSVLFAVTGLSLVSALLIVWLYVGRNVVARLTQLSHATIQIAGGTRDIEVPRAGADEIAAMGRAIEVFRRNAVELDRLVAERSEAAARLEKAVEDRTAELRHREAELRVIFENLSQGIAMFDADRKLVAANRHFKDMLQLPDELVIPGAATFDEFFRHLVRRGEFGEADIEAMVQERVQTSNQPYFAERTRPDGTVLEITRNPVPGGGFVSIYGDITERKRAETEIRTARDAAESAYADLKAAQANLIQAEKMASLGQLTAGIAHEIKNPLNFVNNFAKVSTELIEELGEAVSSALTGAPEDKHNEIAETLQLLSGNLKRINEHGKRADNIVRSMLEHSRGVSVERRTVDLNDLVEEALNLAYHGARAQDHNFSITLEREFAAGMAPVELAPQEITRALLNLFGNGFYAANQRKLTSSDDRFRPTLAVKTRDDGPAVEIKIRDNGTGIAPENREKLFQPFFTTKPTGEGTGLGLSIAYEIVTHGHRGSISVESEVGAFTEFTVRLPREQSV